MECFKLEKISFAYPECDFNALENINLTIKQGEFVLICGKSGCGKTTLLRLLKPPISPFGQRCGEIYFNKKPLSECDSKEQAADIGFVMQNPDNGLVTDTVWHELAFGLESLGIKQAEIRARVAEMASFFGIQNWFYKKVSELSGGQKQLLNLASVMAMQPKVLILDEPTSQLDPIAAGEFLNTLEKINRELGTTVILSEHRLEEAFSMADRVIVLDKGHIFADGTQSETCKMLKAAKHDMYIALPTPARVHGAVENNLPCPITIRQGKEWLEEFSKANPQFNDKIVFEKAETSSQTIIEIKDAWFRYEKNLPDVVKGFNLSVKKGELFCLLGGNGTGKTTALSLVAGLNKPYRGKILINGQEASSIKNLYNGLLAALPQDPQSMFVKKTLYLDLCDVLCEKKLSNEQKEQQIRKVASLCKIQSLLNCHPYDLSGGEQQRAALAKILLLKPQLLLLDEPTKGMDAQFKEELANIFTDLKASGVTILMVSHDIEFCAKHADRCGMVFDGCVLSVDTPREFFKGKSFYTTSASRMARSRLPQAILAEDIILACGGSIAPPPKSTPEHVQITPLCDKENNQGADKAKPTLKRRFSGSIFAVLFALSAAMLALDVCDFSLGHIVDGSDAVRMLSVAFLAIALFCFFPQQKQAVLTAKTTRSEKKPDKKAALAAICVLVLVPLTIFLGSFLLGDRKYYFISLLILLETSIPFFVMFEARKPKAREVVVISVLCALAVSGRMAFFMLPQFKPVVAIVIISGICLGGEAGFLVGAVTAFVSNFFFGQGPWTPWQMLALGIIGFISGLLFGKGLLPKTRTCLCVFGFLATLIIYGGIMNPAAVIMWQSKINLQMLLSAFAVGLPFDLIHAASTAFFLWFISIPMIEKLERIKTKFGF